MARPATMEVRHNAPDPLGTRSLWLVGGRVATGARTAVRADIEIRKGRIRKIVEGTRVQTHRKKASAGAGIDLHGNLILPGLINAHDHLEFNLFPRLGNGPYANYREWAADIYRPDESPLREHLAVPKTVRLWWGGLKNLLAGATTVCHHNPYVPEIFENGFPVRVVKRFAWSHSLAFGKDPSQDCAAAPKDVPFVIHLGEGTDGESAQEIFALRDLHALDSRTVIVHGVGLDEVGRALLEESGAALVWCPTSNTFTLGRTLDFQTLAGHGRIALGSDSAMTAQGDLLDEIRYAHREVGLSPERVYSMVSGLAADVLRLQDGEGTLRVGGRADLVALRDEDKNPATTLVGARFDRVELSMKDGEPQLLSPEMANRWPKEFLHGLAPLTLQGTQRLVRAPLECLLALTRKHLGRRFALAGREVGL